MITNTYGIPRYEEANPACFAVVTFPFLFAVMFGDYGHGSLILIIGLAMVMGHDKLVKMDGMRDAQGLRYLIMMMGMFSCYMGLLYNEFFSIPSDWFGSCYNQDLTDSSYIREGLKEGANSEFNFLPVDETDYGTSCTYLFGLDPTWFIDEGQILIVQNSFKMKMSVIIGVFHMTKGIVVKGFNCVYFSDWHSFAFEVITGLIILLGLFGWMDVLIFAKWFNSYVAYNFLNTEDPAQAAIWANKISQSPSIYNLMINNFLKLGKNEGLNVDGETVPLYLFDGERIFSEIFVVAILISVPIFLCVKPCIAACCPGEHAHEDSPEAVRQSEVNAAEIGNAEEVGLIQKNSFNTMISRENTADAYNSDLSTWEKILKAEYGE